MRYLIVDGYLNGTGIRNKYPDPGEFSYIEPEEIGLSPELSAKIRDWLSRYWDEFFRGYENSKMVEELDNEGLAIANLVQTELDDAKVEYFSDAKMAFIT
jgi:hypothetical protein